MLKHCSCPLHSPALALSRPSHLVKLSLPNISLVIFSKFSCNWIRGCYLKWFASIRKHQWIPRIRENILLTWVLSVSVFISHVLYKKYRPLLPSGSLWMNCVLTAGARSVLPVNGVNETLSVETRAIHRAHVQNAQGQWMYALCTCSIHNIRYSKTPV